MLTRHTRTEMFVFRVRNPLLITNTVEKRERERGSILANPKNNSRENFKYGSGTHNFREVSIFGHGLSGSSFPMPHAAKHGWLYTGSSLTGGGCSPKIISQDRSSKFGFMVRGRPNVLVKKSWVGSCVEVVHNN